MTRPAMRLSIFSVQDHYPASARTLPQLYGQVIAQAELADRLGYDTFFVAEHHFHEYGAVPNPSVMLSTLAQRTKRLRLGSAISILTFHHPLTVAESYAMVDVLSGGRLVLGVGSGYLKHEFEGYHIDPAEKREMWFASKRSPWYHSGEYSAAPCVRNTVANCSDQACDTPSASAKGR